MQTNEKTATATCGNYVVVETFIGERSKADALGNFFSKEIRKSTISKSWRGTEFIQRL